MDARIKVLATQHNIPTKMRIDGDSEKHISNRVGRSISKLVTAPENSWAVWAIIQEGGIALA